MSKEFETIVLKNFKELNSRMDNMESRMDNMEFSMNSRMDKMDARMDGTDSRLDNIERILLIIEDQVMNKIPLLFDGYSMHQEIQQNQQKSINSLDEKVEDHNIRISYLEEKIV